MFARGGFPDAARALFALLAGLALLACLVTARDAAARAARSPVSLILGALAILAVASAAWTVGRPADAIRYGLVIAGYGALAVTGAVVASERRGRVAIYALIAALAAVSGVVGLIGAGIQEPPYGQRIGGSWQAAGTFEYAPANALLQVVALPILLLAMAGERRAVGLAAAAGAAIAGAVLGLSDSLYVSLAAVAVLAVAVIAPRATLGRSRAVPLAAVLLVVAAAVGAHLLAGRFAPFCETGGDGERLAGLGAIVLAAAALWALARRRLLGEEGSTLAPLCALGAAAAIAAGGAALDPESGCVATTRAVEPYAGVLHGRLDQWDAAIQTAEDRPLAGSGADAFYAASAEYREGTSLYAHDLPLELWAELGLAGAALALALYAATGLALVRARGSPALWLVGPGVLAFALANLVDWPWHLAGAGAVFALGLGVLVAPSPPRGGSAGRPPVHPRSW